MASWDEATSCCSLCPIHGWRESFDSKIFFDRIIKAPLKILRTFAHSYWCSATSAETNVRFVRSSRP